MRWLLVLVFAAGCSLIRPAVAGPVESELVQSDEPFVANPRFCGNIGNACAVQPTPC